MSRSPPHGAERTRGRPSIVKLRQSTRSGGLLEHKFVEGMFLVISDACPTIEVLVQGGHLQVGKAHQNAIHGELLEVARDAGDPYWRQWSLVEPVSTTRRTGLIELELKSPRTTLGAYVIPEKLFSLPDLWAMAEDIERELDVAVTWESRYASKTRAWSVPRSANELIAATIEKVEHEALHAAAVRRRPILEPSPLRALQPVPGPAALLGPAPENALVTAWASKRRRHLDEHRSRLQRHIGWLHARGRERQDDKLLENFRVEADHAEQLLARLDALSSRLVGFVDPAEVGAPISLSPLLQRDHRLRALLRAFAPPRSETTSETMSDFSDFPPSTINDLFERWGAVWLARQIRKLGLHGEPTKEDRGLRAQGTTWHLQNGAISVVLDYEPHPPRLDLSRVVPIEERSTCSVEAAIVDSNVSPERPLFATGKQSSPDYVIRVEGPRGAVLAVGDATLADPKHQGADGPEKLKKIETYRREICWRRGDEVVRCEPFGGFVLLPGPSEDWEKIRLDEARRDVWLICPRPRVEDDSAALRFRLLLERLIARVS